MGLLKFKLIVIKFSLPEPCPVNWFESCLFFQFCGAKATDKDDNVGVTVLSKSDRVSASLFSQSRTQVSPKSRTQVRAKNYLSNVNYYREFWLSLCSESSAQETSEGIDTSLVD